MAKLVPLRQTMEIEKVFTDVRVGGLVTDSNFLEVGERHMFPIHDEVVDFVKAGDKLRVTFFAHKEDMEQEEDRLRFKSRGIKYEVWNEQNEGWDRLFEQMNPQPTED